MIVRVVSINERAYLIYNKNVAMHKEEKEKNHYQLIAKHTLLFYLHDRYQYQETGEEQLRKLISKVQYRLKTNILYNWVEDFNLKE